MALNEILKGDRSKNNIFWKKKKGTLHSFSLFLEEAYMEEDSHINYLKVTVPESAQGQRIRRWLLGNHRDITKSQKNLHRAFSRNEIYVNGKPVEECRLLIKDDVVEIKYNKSIEEAEKMKVIPIRICYEDTQLVVVWKPSGQVRLEKKITDRSNKESLTKLTFSQQ